MLLSAVIFDLNGTILTDEDEYSRAFNKVLALVGVKQDGEIPHFTGIGVRENWEKFESKYKFKTDKTLDELTLETQKEYLKQLDTVRVRAGFEDLIDNLRGSDIKTALATSNEWWVVEEIFKKTNIENYFDVITTGEEVSYNKPDPDIFILTAEKLGVERGECLVFEDTVSGVTAAVRAGMRVVGVADNADLAESLSEEANMVVSNFLEINPESLANL